METVYEKYKPSLEILLEYHWYQDHRELIRQEWLHEDGKFERHCESLYQAYKKAYEHEQKLKKSKSEKIAKKLENLRKIKPDYSETVLLKKLKQK